jgi:hypothetical protein
MLVSPAHYVIGKLGGLTKTANALGIPVTTVQGWRDRSRIPQDHWQALIAAAKGRGAVLSLSDFLKDHFEEDRPATPSETRERAAS